MLAAALAIVGALIAVFWNQGPSDAPVAQIDEAQAQGFAVVHRVTGEQSSHPAGATLAGEVLTLGGGYAEIHFYCGARVVLQGPARLEVESAWKAICHEGSLRADVPPAAQGFRIHAAQTEIIDLGTSFGLSVEDGNATVEVLDGEIAIRHRDEQELRLQTGQARFLPADGPHRSAASTWASEKVAIPQEEPSAHSFTRWQTYREALLQRPDLIAFYDGQTKNSTLPNLAPRTG
ncbi:MAG: FecR domain-containing protein, partial [Verrucomicrobiota bacterium]